MTALSNATGCDRPKVAPSWAEPNRRDSQDHTLIGGARARRKRRSERQGRKQDAFFGHARTRRHYSYEDRKHRGARREGWDPWIIARSYFFFLYIVLYLGGVHTYEVQDWVPRAGRNGANSGTKNKEVERSYKYVLLYIYTYTIETIFIWFLITSHIFN